jgi:hypothetical protein
LHGVPAHTPIVPPAPPPHQIIPRQLCDNAGFDATDVLNKLRQKHALADGSGKVRWPM